MSSLVPMATGSIKQLIPWTDEPLYSPLPARVRGSCPPLSSAALRPDDAFTAFRLSAVIASIDQLLSAGRVLLQLEKRIQRRLQAVWMKTGGRIFSFFSELPAKKTFKNDLYQALNRKTSIYCRTFHTFPMNCAVLSLLFWLKFQFFLLFHHPHGVCWRFLPNLPSRRWFLLPSLTLECTFSHKFGLIKTIKILNCLVLITLEWLILFCGAWTQPGLLFYK